MTVRRVVIALALGAYLVVLLRNTCYFAAGPDSSGYLNEARLLASGRTRLFVEPLRTFNLDPSLIHVFTPYGFMHSGPRTLVPTYPAGTPLHMIAAAKIGGWTVAPFVISPLLAIGCLLLIYAIGRDLGLPPVERIAAMTILAAFPSFIALAVQPVSDIPGLFWTLAAMWFAICAKRQPAFAAAAGVAFGISVGVRPSNLLLALPLAFAMRWRPSRLVISASAALPIGIALMWFNNRLYGSPLRTGYGSFREQVDLHVMLRCGPSHLLWILRMLTPAVMPLALLVVFDKCVDRWTRAMLVAWFGVFWLFYASYGICDEPDIRFLLPALSALIIATCLLLRRLPRVVAALVFVAILGDEIHYDGQRWHVLQTARSESIYPESVRWAEARVPGNALVFSGLLTGAFFYDSHRFTARWDAMTVERCQTLQASAAGTLPWYAVLSIVEADGDELARRMPGRWTEVGAFRTIRMWRYERK